MDKENNKGPTIIDLNSRRDLSKDIEKHIDSLKTDEEKAEYFLKLGKEELLNNLENCKGFIAIIFDDDNEQRTLFAGSLEPLTTVGVLELVKQNFMSETLYSFSDTEYMGE